MEHPDSLSAAHVNEDIIGSVTSVEDIIDALDKRGCSNLTSAINTAACSTFPCAGGGFCDVFEGALHDGTRIAIKMLRIFDRPGQDNGGQKILKRTARELYHWSKLHHCNVLPLMGLAVFRAQISMVSKWMENGNLMAYLRLNPGANRIKLCMDVCAGLCYIHRNNMVHGDLKAANIMVSSDGTALINDFGNAELRDLTLKFTNTTTRAGLSIRWTAPELLLASSNPRGSKEADVYAYGMTVLEAMTGEVPFDGMADFQVLWLVAHTKGVPPRPDTSMDDELWGILNLCWAQEPTARPPIAYVQDWLQTLTKPAFDEARAAETDEDKRKRDQEEQRLQRIEQEAWEAIWAAQELYTKLLAMNQWKRDETEEALEVSSKRRKSKYMELDENGPPSKRRRRDTLGFTALPSNPFNQFVSGTTPTPTQPPQFVVSNERGLTAAENGPVSDADESSDSSPSSASEDEDDMDDEGVEESEEDENTPMEPGEEVPPLETKYLPIFKALHERGKVLTQPETAYLVDLTGMTYRQITSWFQNRRRGDLKGDVNARNPNRAASARSDQTSDLSDDELGLAQPSDTIFDIRSWRLASALASGDTSPPAFPPNPTRIGSTDAIAPHLDSDTDSDFSDSDGESSCTSDEATVFDSSSDRGLATAGSASPTITLHSPPGSAQAAANPSGVLAASLVMSSRSPNSAPSPSPSSNSDSSHQPAVKPLLRLPRRTGYAPRPRPPPSSSVVLAPVVLPSSSNPSLTGTALGVSSRPNVPLLSIPPEMEERLVAITGRMGAGAAANEQTPSPSTDTSGIPQRGTPFNFGQSSLPRAGSSSRTFGGATPTLPPRSGHRGSVPRS